MWNGIFSFMTTNTTSSTTTDEDEGPPPLREATPSPPPAPQSYPSPPSDLVNTHPPEQASVNTSNLDVQPQPSSSRSEEMFSELKEMLSQDIRERKSQVDNDCRK
jgi:hypothetical protein